jgi:prophage antirepressor-like protein
MWVINEPGLYTLILRSNKPEAKAFKKWVTTEVLPSIRKTGGYRVSPADAISPIVARLAEVAHKERVVPTSAKILAYHRWHNTRKGVEAFGELCIQLELDFRPLAPGDRQGELTDGAA